MARTSNCLYLEVTSDKYEFPIHICDSVKELCAVTGATETNIRSCLSKVKSGVLKKCRFVKVELTQ